MAAALLDLARSTSANSRTLATLTQALSDSLARSATGASDLAARFDDTISQSIIRTGSREEMIRFVRAYAALPPRRKTLRALVTDHLPAADIDPTLALLDQLTDADVAAVFKAVSKEARRIYQPMIGVLDLLVVACQEDMPFNSIDGMKATVAGLKYPFLAQSSYANDFAVIKACQYLPPAPTEGYHDAVVSDIPTLVLYGWLDTQTSTEDTELAAASLTNARVLGFPEAGHAALVFSQCARDIGFAFVERPADALATDCIEPLKPKWVLPPG